MTARTLLGLALLPLAIGCSKDESPSFNATVIYTSGASVQIHGGSQEWHLDPALPAGGTPGIRIIAMPDSTPGLAAGLAQVADFEIWIAGSTVAQFPVAIGGHVDQFTGPDTLVAVAATTTFPFGADSGTVQVTPLGGNKVHVDFDVWFGVGAAGPTFRLVGAMIAPKQ